MKPGVDPSARQPSESLVGTLCRAMEAMRRRGGQINAHLEHCQDAGLSERLREEFQELQQRRRDLQGLVRVLQRSGLNDSLALAFLAEITRRPLIPLEVIRS